LATLQDVNSSLSSANTAYELQLKAVESANAEIEAYKANATKLNSQVSSLNEVYGNMLSALA
jgi:cell division protein FtsB